ALEAEGRAWLAGEGIAAEHQRLERDVEARYLGQSFEVAVPFDPSAPLSEVLASFHARHEESQGFRLSERGVEAVTLRLRASAAAAEMPPPTGGDGPPVADAWRAVSFGEAPVMTRILDRMALATGGAVEGPAIIEEDTATTIVAPGWQAVATPSGTLVLSRVGGP
ncbi:MAG: hydantoinase/oxoprolinase family protein, partial [Pseudomonadota bacterium]